MMNRPIATAGWLILALLLSACGDGHDDLRSWMVDSTKDIQGRIQSLPKVKDYEAAVYDVEGEIDPFRPNKIAPERKKGGVNQPDFNRPREPLESFPLESLGYVGFVIRNQVPFAIIKADQALYQVRAGNYAGQEFGVIVNIDETEVVLKELITDAGGDWTERTSTLKLQDAGNQEGQK